MTRSSRPWRQRSTPPAPGMWPCGRAAAAPGTRRQQAPTSLRRQHWTNRGRRASPPAQRSLKTWPPRLSLPSTCRPPRQRPWSCTLWRPLLLPHCHSRRCSGPAPPRRHTTRCELRRSRRRRHAWPRRPPAGGACASGPTSWRCGTSMRLPWGWMLPPQLSSNSLQSGRPSCWSHLRRRAPPAQPRHQPRPRRGRPMPPLQRRGTASGGLARRRRCLPSPQSSSRRCRRHRLQAVAPAATAAALAARPPAAAC